MTHECPICLNDIETNNNCVTTECGHKFHCSCLFQNAAHNGFGCPYCRTSLAEEVLDKDDEEDDEDDEEDEDDDDWNEGYYNEHNEESFQEVSLETFRMFHQRLNGEEVEEGTEIREEPIYPEDYDERAGDGIPNAEYVSRKLLERGITHQDLVRSLLAVDHDDLLEGWGIMYREKSSQVYGQIRKVIHQSKRNYLRNINQDPTNNQPLQQINQEQDFNNRPIIVSRLGREVINSV
jgi:hypothetical protein